MAILAPKHISIHIIVIKNGTTNTKTITIKRI